MLARFAASMASSVALVERVYVSGRSSLSLSRSRHVAAVHHRSRSHSPVRSRVGELPHVRGIAVGVAASHHHAAAGSLFQGTALAPVHRRHSTTRHIARAATGPQASVSYGKEPKGTNPSLEYRVFVKEGAKARAGPGGGIVLPASFLR